MAPLTFGDHSPVARTSKPAHRGTKVVKSDMKAFTPYVESLESLVCRAAALESLSPEDKAQIAATLNGQPSQRLRDIVELDVRRRAGAFFTGQSIAERAIEPHYPTLSAESLVYDPACGAADLLLAYARRLPVARDLAATLRSWGQQLHGCDLYPEFIRAAKARLILLALSRGVSAHCSYVPLLDRTFPNLKVADGLTGAASWPASHIILNPPYLTVPAPADCAWGTGAVSQAAVFLDRCLASAAAGTRVVAILPDVLRSGSRYARWRATVEARGLIESVDIIGAFDPWADVDVFVLRLIVAERSEAPVATWCSQPLAGPEEHLGDHFDVHVGPVVPHRHPETGRLHPYLQARLLPAWQTCSVSSAPRRRFGGRTFAPPFVVVRRTSAPSDQSRALGTLIVGRQKVAIENHLLVLVPGDGKEATCRRLLSVLQDERTRRWLDQRIRCRHLTVAALLEIPWWDTAR